MPALALAGCALQTYQPAPLDAARIVAGLSARSVSDQGLRDFMGRHGVATDVWPLPRWDLTALTLVAVYFHPDMAVARARLEVQRTAEITAARLRNPAIAPVLEHHGNTDATQDTPWSFGITLDLPITAADRLAARRARAEALSTEARVAVAAAAWRVRSRLRRRYIDGFAAAGLATLLRRQLEAQQRGLALLETRQALGEASPTEVSTSRLRLQEARLALDAAEGAMGTARAALAEALGLSFAAARALAVPFTALEAGDPPVLPPGEVQRAALRNRLDIRQADARYAGAEAALKLEIAKQYPEFSLSPGFLWDQGDLVKAIGGAVLLPVFDRNQGPIAEARARRSLEAARYEALQAQVMGELSRMTARYEAAVRAWRTAKDLVEEQQARMTRTRKLFTYGEAGRLMLVQAEIELIAAERARLEARIAALRALGDVEDAVQRPLDGSAPPPREAAAPMPGGGAAPATAGGAAIAAPGRK